MISRRRLLLSGLALSVAAACNRFWPSALEAAPKLRAGQWYRVECCTEGFVLSAYVKPSVDSCPVAIVERFDVERGILTLRSVPRKGTTFMLKVARA